MSTLGPSGPKEQPVPNVIAAWTALIKGNTPESNSQPCLEEALDWFICSVI
ncbi:hypothetical protein ACHQM5_019190 [Ranunculus cassubicifolius]